MKIIGHRGAAGLQFENTIKSIAKAISLGVDYIEIDVWQTNDNEIIVFHDAYLDRLTSQKGFVEQMSYKQIRQTSLNNGDKIPLLKEVIDLVKNKVKLLVEVKSECAFEKTLEILEENLTYSDFIIGSFFHQGIMKFKKRNILIQTAIMFECVPVELDKYLKKVDPNFVVISIETYNKYLIDIINFQNRDLIFYTVNSQPEIELALEVKPFAIITNYPNLFNSESRTHKSIAASGAETAQHQQ